MKTSINIKWLPDTEEYRVRGAGFAGDGFYTTNVSDAYDTALTESKRHGNVPILSCPTTARRLKAAGYILLGA